MKRYKNLYSKIYDMNNLALAHENAQKGKGWYKEVIMVNSDPKKIFIKTSKRFNK